MKLVWTVMIYWLICKSHFLIISESYIILYASYIYLYFIWIDYLFLQPIIDTGSKDIILIPKLIINHLKTVHSYTDFSGYRLVTVALLLMFYTNSQTVTILRHVLENVVRKCIIWVMIDAMVNEIDRSFVYFWSVNRSKLHTDKI